MFQNSIAEIQTKISLSDAGNYCISVDPAYLMGDSYRISVDLAYLMGGNYRILECKNWLIVMPLVPVYRVGELDRAGAVLEAYVLNTASGATITPPYRHKNNTC